MSDRPRITVVGVIRSLGIEPTPELTWAVGKIMQAEYADEYGEQPPKDLCKKTYDTGTHCFALYPYEWHERIATVVRRMNAIASSQGRLFDGV